MFLDGGRAGEMPNSEMLGVVEDMARRLLTEEEVAAVMKTCRRVGRGVKICRHTECLCVDLCSVLIQGSNKCLFVRCH